MQTLCEAGLRLLELQHAGLLSTYHIMTLAMDIEDPCASEEVSRFEIVCLHQLPNGGCMYFQFVLTFGDWQKCVFKKWSKKLRNL